MTLEAGARLGPYEIVTAIGAGGMGEVYKAKDTRLDRTVAIKVLPAHLSESAELRHRFEQEARAVSSLNHPHICTLHDVGQEGSTDFLVMEYLEGEPLVDRLKKGPLPLSEALAYAIQIADALDKAHRQGVVHRDLKPGNIIITMSGNAKLLDFGLAKLRQGGAADGDLSAVTEQKPLTEKGTILGTFQYMAPEQLEGKEADARTDIFAFGALLYEMVTGKKAFEGKSQASLIGAIMSSAPPSISAVQPVSPPLLDHLVERCLAKDPDARWQTASDVMHELAWLAGAGGQVSAAEHAAPRGRPQVLAVGGLVLGAVLATLAGVLFRATPMPPSPVRFKMSLPSNEPLIQTRPAVAVSPDGTRIAYATGSGIYVRSLDEAEPTLLPGTENATNPFFSPDSQWIGFWSAGQLRRVALAGGAPVTICEARNVFGADWGPDDTIVFGYIGGIWRVPASGGAPEQIVVTDGAPGEWGWGPQFLPDGKSVVFGAGTGTSVESVSGTRILVASLETGERRELIPGAWNARYVPSGHLVYAQSGNLLAIPFDARQLETTGGPVSVSENVSPFQFATSSRGALVYTPDTFGAGASTLAWVDRQGRPTPLTADPAAYLTPRLSPDGDRVAVEINADIWVYYVDQGTRTRLTFDGAGNGDPVWSPDGSRLVFRSQKEAGDNDTFWMRADGGGDVEPLVIVQGTAQDPHSLSPDGKHLAYYQREPPSSRDIWLLPLEGEREPESFLVTPFNERSPSFSPDGRFLAYVSDESGRDEVYVQRVDRSGGKVPVSTGGGREPVWSRDGRELFFWSENRLMAVDVDTGSTFRAGAPQLLFEAPYIRQATSGSGSQNYDVSPDGERFLMVLPGEAAMELHVVLNWFDELERLVPTNP